MSESAMWDHLKEKIVGRVNAERITERLNDGVPDVVYQFASGEAGWCELKYVAGVGKDVLRIPWKSTAQPFWLQRWRRWGGRSGVLLRIERRGWFYWRPTDDIRWVEWAQNPVGLDTATWRCGERLDVTGLCAAWKAL